MTQTPREKRLQSRAERTEKVQTKEGTTKTTKHELKRKTHPAKQVEATSTGSLKTVSTGSMDTEQQKDKSPEILAREVATMLSTLSTPPKQKGKRKRKTSLYFKARRST